MIQGGFYLMHRGWQDHPVFRNEEYSRRDAFVWLIEEAAYRPTRIHAGAGTISLNRGQLSHSLRFMAKAWKWDEAKVRRFLTSLSKSEIIDASTDAGQTVITICNYDKYQSSEDEPDAPTDAATTQQRRGGDAKNKEVKEVKNIDDVVECAREPENPGAVVEVTTDLLALSNQVCRAGGVRNVDPASIGKNLIIVRGWVNEGFDPTTTIIPAVQEALAKATEPISSIRYFDRAIRQFHARKDALENGYQPRENDAGPQNPMVRAYVASRARRASQGSDDDGIRVPPCHF